MAIRHFRRKNEHEEAYESSSESSSDEESIVQMPRDEPIPREAISLEQRQPNSNIKRPLESGGHQLSDSVVDLSETEEETTAVTKPDQDAEESENSSDDSSSSSSSSDDQYVLHKPVFIKNLRKKADSAQNTESKERDELRRKEATAARIQHDQARISEAQKLAKATAGYGIDRDLVRSILELDDDDAKDPQKEHEAWIQRQEARAQRLRHALEEKQLALEEYEAAKLENSIADENLSKTPKSGDRDESKTVQLPIESTGSGSSAAVSSLRSNHPYSGKRKSKAGGSAHNNKKYKPQSVRNDNISLNVKHHDQHEAEDNEYSVI